HHTCDRGIDTLEDADYRGAVRAWKIGSAVVGSHSLGAAVFRCGPVCIFRSHDRDSGVLRASRYMATGRHRDVVSGLEHRIELPVFSLASQRWATLRDISGGIL